MNHKHFLKLLDFTPAEIQEFLDRHIARQHD